jgi:hypothetical protein
MNLWIIPVILYVWSSIGSLSGMEYQFNMYETDQNITLRQSYRDCLLYYVLDNIVRPFYISYIVQHQIISRKVNH